MKIEIHGDTAIFAKMNQPGIFADIGGNLSIAGVRYRVSPGGINPTIPADGDVPIAFEADGGKVYPVRLAKVRGGRIVPAVSDADVVELLARVLRLEEKADALADALASTDAKVDADLLGSIF